MADAVVSMALERLADVIQRQIQEEVNLVRGVKKEVGFLSSKLNTIRNVVADAESRRYKDKTVQNWLNKLEDVSYDIEDVVDEWNFAALKLRIEGSEDFPSSRMKVCPFIPSSCLCLSEVAMRRDIAKKIKELKERVKEIFNEKDDFGFIVNQPVDPRESTRDPSTSLVDVWEIHGRENDRDDLVSKLQPGPRVVSIVGAGGIGKTTLAQLVYNDHRLVSCFEVRIWVCVSDVFDGIRIAKGIIESVNGRSPDLNELDSLLNCLKNSILGKQFLLVLDDVWIEDYTKWEPFKNSLNCGGLGSKILVTTRNERVARMMGTTEAHRLGLLSDEDCWLLMKRLAFCGRGEEDSKELQEVGKKIANKCKGLPLAAKVLGSLLRFKDTKEEWEHILDSEIWQLREAEVELFPHLFLSYNELSPAMKRCFSYCAIFPKDWKINVAKVIRMWMALGYLDSTGSTSDLELRGKEYFNNLRMRSFFQDFDHKEDFAYCKMHDIVHDFAQFLMKTKSHGLDDRVEARKNGSSPIYDPSLVSKVKVYRSLFCEEELPCELIENIACLRVLSFHRWQLQEIPRGVENLIHLRYLNLSNSQSLGEVPQTLCKLYYLQSLYLSYCNLKDIPQEIGNLIHLRHLDLSMNACIEELPESIGNLHDLRTLDLSFCEGLRTLPEGIKRLVNLRHLLNEHTDILHHFPQGFERLAGLLTLQEFHGGRDWSKLGCLKKFDQISGSLRLKIRLHDRQDVDEAQNAELRSKMNI